MALVSLLYHHSPVFAVVTRCNAVLFGIQPVFPKIYPELKAIPGIRSLNDRNLAIAFPIRRFVKTVTSCENKSSLPTKPLPLTEEDAAKSFKIQTRFNLRRDVALVR